MTNLLVCCSFSWGTTWGVNGYMHVERDRNNMCGIATAVYIPEAILQLRVTPLPDAHTDSSEYSSDIHDMMAHGHDTIDENHHDSQIDWYEFLSPKPSGGPDTTHHRPHTADHLPEKMRPGPDTLGFYQDNPQEGRDKPSGGQSEEHGGIGDGQSGGHKTAQWDGPVVTRFFQPASNASMLWPTPLLSTGLPFFCMCSIAVMLTRSTCFD